MFDANVAGDQVTVIGNLSLVTSGQGGAILLGGNDQFNTPRLGNLTCQLSDGVMFLDNSAAQGGSIAALRVGPLTMNNVDFVTSFAIVGGGIYLESENNRMASLPSFSTVYPVQAKNATFRGNLASRGAALHANIMTNDADLKIADQEGSGDSNDSLVDREIGFDAISFEDSKFLDNVGEVAGGALYSKRGNVRCISCLFVRNTLTGARSAGGAIWIAEKAQFQGDNVTFRDNIATDGGAVYVDNAQAILEAALISNNTANSQGGGMFIKTSPDTVFPLGIVSRLSESIIKGNRAHTGGKYWVIPWEKDSTDSQYPFIF